jgi:hypothetical protein
MATAVDPDVSASRHLAQERHRQRALRTITGPGWRQRLAPLAEHMGNRRLIRARSARGGALAVLDLDTLQQALLRLLGLAPTQGYLVVRLALENAPADIVAAETGLDPVQQVATAKAALAALALEYESVAFASVVAEPSPLGAARKGLRSCRDTRTATVDP